MRPQVIVSFRDQSQVVPQSGGTIGAVFINAPKGDTRKAILVSSVQELLDIFTPAGWRYTYDRTFLTAIYFLTYGRSPLYVVRTYDTATTYYANSIYQYTTAWSESHRPAFTESEYDSYTSTNDTILVVGKNPGDWANGYSISFSRPSPRPSDMPPDATHKLEIYSPDGVLLEQFYISFDPEAVGWNKESIYLPNIRSKYVKFKVFYASPGDLSRFLSIASTLPMALTLSNGQHTDASDKSSFLHLLDSENVFMIMDSDADSDAFQRAIVDYCAFRADCVALLSVGLSAQDSITSVKSYTDNIRSGVSNPSFGAIYTPSIQWFYSGRPVLVPPSAVVGVAITRNAENFETWYPPAGLNYGAVSGKPAIEYTLAEQDTLYEDGINPIVKHPEGTFIWGQKTLQLAPTALNRLNVRLLLNTIIPPIKTVLKSFLFEFNDEITRRRVVATIEPFLENIKSRRGLYDFRVVCDETNNTPEDIDNNRMNVDLYLQPTKTAEIIRLTVTITRTGVQIS